MKDTQHPWQSGPTELIACALDHFHKKTDLDQRIAYLLLDVGVETLFKTYLTLPDRIVGTKLSFADRKRSTGGNFHELCEGVERVGGARLKGIDITHVEHYHSVRNQLYHEGSGITVPAAKVQEYAKVSVDLLRQLLNVDLDDELRKPEIEAQRAAEEKAEQEREKREIDEQTAKVEQARQALAQTAAMAVEKVDPRLALPSFTSCFDRLRDAARRQELIADPSPEIHQARAALADLVVPPGMLNLGIYEDSTEFYLGILEMLLRSQAPPDLSPSAMWFYVCQTSAGYPKNVGPKLVGYDEEHDEPIAEEISHEEVLAEGRAQEKTLEEIRQFLENWSERPEIPAVTTTNPTPRPPPLEAETESRYDAFREWLRARPEDLQIITLKFNDIEGIIGRALPPSAYKHREWWANHSKNASGGAWLRGGWRVQQVHLSETEVSFRRTRVGLIQAFFSDALNRVKAARSGLTWQSKDRITPDWRLTTSRPGFYYFWEFQPGSLQMAFSIDLGDTRSNDSLYMRLFAKRAEIEGQIGVELNWQQTPEKHECRIFATMPASITDATEEREGSKKWLVDMTLRFIDCFQPRIQEL